MKAELERTAKAVLETIAETMLAVKHGESEARFRPVEFRFKWAFSKLAGAAFGRNDRWQRTALAGQPAGVFRDQVPLIKLLSGQALGADRILESAAMTLSTRVNAVQVQSVPIIVNDGHLVAPGAYSVGKIPDKSKVNSIVTRTDALKEAAVHRARARGYRAQAEALRHHSDLLIAAWDPAADGKPGGTAETVALALAENIPVVALRYDAEGNVTVALLERPSELNSHAGVAYRAQDLMAAPDEQLARVFASISEETRNLLAFPDAPAASGAAWYLWWFRLFCGRSTAVPHGHPAQHSDHPHKPFTTYDPRVAFHCVRTGVDLGKPWPADCWDQFYNWVKKRPWIPIFNTLSDKDLRPGRSHFYNPARSRVADLSRTFGNAYRGGVLMAYSLGATAVALSILGVYLHFGGAPLWAQGLVGVAELCVLLKLATLAFVSTVESWHEFYTDTRMLAEALRCMNYLGPLGVHTPLPKLPPYLAGGRAGNLDHDPRRSWSVWYLRALIREAPLQWAGGEDGRPIPPKQMQAILAHGWIGSPTRTVLNSQVDYHRKAAAVHRTIFEGIEWVTRLTFYLVILAVVIHVGALYFEDKSEHSGGHKPAGVMNLGTVLQVIGILSPALLGALGGFLAQIGCQRLLQRSESMEQTLEERFQVLSTVNTEDPESIDANWQLAREAAITAARMVDESAGWALIYKNSDIHVG